MGKIIRQWIGDLFDGLRIACTNGTCWDFEDKISERSSVDSNLYLKSKIPEADAQGSLQCPVVSRRIYDELEFLNFLELGSAPKEGVHPAHYIVFVVMGTVPGVPLTDFWTYDRPKRDRIREAFQKGMTEIRSFYSYFTDMGRQNLIYDENKDKCYEAYIA
ncbi:hypothetical protein GX51_00312 [Blastomyces parvus]|uniref:Uncharacterized protein n=1 Tax=Blastomyces parvus TaxID=2060905 RepID=A0A2B7XM70_9EURO|nr:hypothetical protein GX51_00312 [Blastomyces parvus]